jgi:hypothetical protein
MSTFFNTFVAANRKLTTKICIFFVFILQLLYSNNISTIQVILVCPYVLPALSGDKYNFFYK